MTSLEELVSAICELGSQQVPLMLAVDGPSAAGKSTLASRLASTLGASVVHMDDFYRDLTDEVRRTLRPVEGVERFFDWQRLRREALEPLSRAETVCFPCFDWETGCGLTASEHAVEAAPVVILEGVYAARPELGDLMHQLVLVETTPERRAQRRAERAVDHDGLETRWDAAEHHYFSYIRPRHFFHHVISGETECPLLSDP